MIDIIVAIITDEDGLKDTLYSLGNQCSENIILCASEKDKDKFDVNKYRELLPKATVTLCYSNDDNSLAKFFTGLDNIHAKGDYVTFLKSGDTICADYIFAKMEKILNFSPNINIVETNIIGENCIPAYASKYMNIQGKLFRKSFFEYYDFIREFKNEIEFSLYFSYVCDLNPNASLKLDEISVHMMPLIEGRAEAVIDLFSNILPKQNDYDIYLVSTYLYQILCDFYFNYIGEINLDFEEDALASLLNEIKIFYNFFRTCNLDENLDLFLQTYNENVLRHYATFNDPVNLKIPVISIVNFLEQLEREVNA